MTNSSRTGRQVLLASRPVGVPVLDDLCVVSTTIPEPAPGEVLVRNLLHSVDAATRMRMSDVGVPLPLFALGEAISGDAVGTVIVSTSPDLAVGDLVRHGLGWRDYAVAAAAGVRRIDPDAFPTLSAHLAPTLTAWVAVVDVGGLVRGETVFVSGAAGAVGGIAGQMARLRGAGRVVGSAGGPAKLAHLTETLGFDGAFDYHDGDLVERLRETAPDGVDVYVDTTGGEQLEAAIEVMNRGGRIVLCGALATMVAGVRRPGPANLVLAIAKRLTLRGFLTSDHLGRAATVDAEVAGWLRDGRLRLDETLVDGLENVPRAFVDLLGGRYTGRVLARVSP